MYNPWDDFGVLSENWGTIYSSLRWILKDSSMTRKEKQFYISKFIESTNMIVELFQR